jgi:prepilin-type N-terminal cleavage/methylation domain-containing protein
MGFKVNKGFTLIEMIITIVVLGILGVFTFAFFGNYMSTYTQMRDRRNLHQEAVYILERIARELRDATTVTSTSPLSFQIPSSALATGGDTSTTISYSLSGTQLNRTGNTSGSILMGDNINAFTVTAITSPVTNCYRITVQRGTESYTTAVCPKNIPSGSSGFGGNYADVF